MLSALLSVHPLGNSLFTSGPWTKSTRITTLPQPMDSDCLEMTTVPVEFAKLFEDAYLKPFLNLVDNLVVLDDQKSNSEEVLAFFQRVDQSLSTLDGFYLRTIRKAKPMKGIFPKFIDLIDWVVSLVPLIKLDSKQYESVISKSIRVLSVLSTPELIQKDFVAGHVVSVVRHLFTESEVLRITMADFIAKNLFVFEKKNDLVKKIGFMMVSQDFLHMFHDVVSGSSKASPMFTSLFIDILLSIRINLSGKKDHEKSSIQLVDSILETCIPYLFNLLTSPSPALTLSVAKMLHYLASTKQTYESVKQYCTLSVGYLSVLSCFVRFSSAGNLCMPFVELLQVLTAGDTTTFGILLKALPVGWIATMLPKASFPPSANLLFELVYSKPAPVGLNFISLSNAIQKPSLHPTFIVNAEVKGDLVHHLDDEVESFYKAATSIKNCQFVWNSQDYAVELKSLQNHVHVSGFYLAAITNPEIQIPLEYVQKLLTDSFHELCLIQRDSPSCSVILSAMTILSKVIIKSITGEKEVQFIPSFPQIKHLIPYLLDAEGHFLDELISFFSIAVQIPSNISSVTVSVDGISIILETALKEASKADNSNMSKLIEMIVFLSASSLSNQSQKVVVYPPSPAFRSLVSTNNLPRIVSLLNEEQQVLVSHGYSILTNIVATSAGTSSAFNSSGFTESCLYHLCASEDFFLDSAVILSKTSYLVEEMLSVFLPKALIVALAPISKAEKQTEIEEAVEKYKTKFFSESDTHLLVWNDTTRQHLSDYLKKRVSNWTFKQGGCSDYNPPSDFKYPSYAHEIIVDGIFLRNLVKNAGESFKISESGIEDPVSLFKGIIALVESGVQLVSDSACWVLVTIKMIVEEYGKVDKDEVFSKLPPSLLAFVSSFLVVKGKSLAYPGLVSTALETLKSMTCIDFVESNVDCSFNINSFVSSGGVATLCDLMSFYVGKIDSDVLATTNINIIANIIAESLVLATSSLDSTALKPLVMSLSSIFSIIANKNQNDLFKDITKLCVKLCGCTDLAQVLIESGLFFRMVIYLLNSNKENVMNELVAQGILEFAKSSVGSTAFTDLFTPTFSKMLIKSPVSRFLELFLNNTQNPLVLWTDAVRKELVAHLTKQIAHIEKDEPFTLKIDYETHSNELKIDEVFCRLFNAEPDFALPKPREFCTELLAMTQTISESQMAKESKIKQLSLLIRTLNNFVKHQKMSQIPDSVRSKTSLSLYFDCLALGSTDLCEQVCKLISSLVENSTALSEFESLEDKTWKKLVRLTVSDSNEVCEVALLCVSLFVSKSITIATHLTKNSVVFAASYIIFGPRQRANSSSCYSRALAILNSLMKEPTIADEIKSELGKIVPDTIVIGLTERKSGNFDSFYNSDHITPTLIWNDECRTQLAQYLKSLLDELYSDDAHGLITFDRVQYEEFAKHLCLAGIYLAHYVKEEEYPLKNSNFFVEECVFHMEKSKKKLSNADKSVVEESLADLKLVLSAVHKLFTSSQSSISVVSKDLIRVQMLADFITTSTQTDLLKSVLTLLSLIAPYLNKKTAEPCALAVAQNLLDLPKHQDILLTLQIKVVGIDPTALSRLLLGEKFAGTLERLLLTSESAGVQQKCRSLLNTMRSGNETLVNQQIAQVEEEMESQNKVEDNTVDTEEEAPERPDDLETFKMLKNSIKSESPAPEEEQKAE
ncbi:hypothetical protein GEMRC1_003880 [Eukaryota sp. GEM-RC1]